MAFSMVCMSCGHYESAHEAIKRTLANPDIPVAGFPQSLNECKEFTPTFHIYKGSPFYYYLLDINADMNAFPSRETIMEFLHQFCEEDDLDIHQIDTEEWFCENFLDGEKSNKTG